MKKLLLFVLPALLVCGCTDNGIDDDSDSNHPEQPGDGDGDGNGDGNGDEEGVSDIVLTPDGLVFEATGHEKSVRVTLDGGNGNETWDLSGDVSWCIPSVRRGLTEHEVRFTADENTSTDERNASFVFTCGDAKRTLVVTQKQKDALTVTSSKIEMPSEGGTACIEVKANVDYRVEISEACRGWVTPSQADTRAMETTRQLFDVAANTTLERRSGDIMIRSGELNETVTIYQSGEEPTLVLTQNEYDVEAAGGTIKVEINSNIAYTVEIAPEADWIAEQQTRSLSTHTRYFTVAPNNRKARSAELVFRSADYGLEERVVVRQKEADATTVHVPLGQSLMVVMEEMGLNPAVIVRLKISGYLTQADFKFIKENMKLELLDLYEVDLPLLPDLGYGETFGKVADLVLPHNLREIPSYAFSNSYNNALTSVTIPASVETIQAGAFKKCVSLTSVEIPASVVTIQKAAFKGCTSLASVEIPASVEIIEGAAFYGCTSLASVTFEENSRLKEIRTKGSRSYECEGAFENCALTAIKIPAGVTSISEHAFYGNSLDELTFEEGSQLTFIGGGAFPLSSNCVELDLSPCTQLNTIATWPLPASVQTVRLGMLAPPVNATPIPYKSEHLIFTEVDQNCVLMIPREAEISYHWRELGFDNHIRYY